MVALVIAIFAVIFLLVGVVWSFWRTFKINNVLKNVMIETSLTKTAKIKKRFWR